MPEKFRSPSFHRPEIAHSSRLGKIPLCRASASTLQLIEYDLAGPTLDQFIGNWNNMAVPEPQPDTRAADEIQGMFENLRKTAQSWIARETETSRFYSTLAEIKQVYRRISLDNIDQTKQIKGSPKQKLEKLVNSLSVEERRSFVNTVNEKLSALSNNPVSEEIITRTKERWQSYLPPSPRTPLLKRLLGDTSPVPPLPLSGSLYQ